MSLATPEKLLIHELKDLYSAENQLLKALPKMVEAANSPRLKAAFAAHLEETKLHIGRIEQCFESLEGSPTGVACKGMAGLLEEGAEVLKEKDGADPAVFDCALIGAAQRVEHYEIAAYGTARALAEQLGLTQIAQLLQETLDNEGQTNRKLTELAVSEINIKAKQASAGA